MLIIGHEPTGRVLINKQGFSIRFAQRSGAQWFFDVEQTFPNQRFVDLYTDTSGFGLYLDRELAASKELIPSTQFGIPAGMDKRHAVCLVTTALSQLGW